MKIARGKKKELQDKALRYLSLCSSDNDELVQSHIDGLASYMQDELGNEIEGRSQVVMSDVSDTIEWMMPALMKIFYGGHKVLNLTPMEPEDEAKAPLMEEKVNFDVQKGINGYLLLHDWFKEALLGKYSCVKYWWEEAEEKKYVEYSNLLPQEVEALHSMDDMEITEITATLESDDIMGRVDVKCTKTIDISKPMAVVVPPEEMIVNIRSGSVLSESDFIAHRKRVHKTHLKKYGIKTKEYNDVREYFNNGEALEDQRYKDLGGAHFIEENDDEDFVYIYECYFADYTSEGDPIPMKVVIFGNRVLEAVENTYGKPPFCSLTSIRVPHRFAGRSLAELVKDIQDLKTGLMRSILDNLYYQNNGVTVVNPYRINMDDVIDRNEPGAKWRTLYDTDPKGTFAPVPSNPMAPQAFSLLSTIDDIQEKRTGISTFNQNAPQTGNNSTATGISQMLGAAQARMELIARTFGETGVKELYQAFVDMNLDFFDREQAIRVNKDWLKVTPQDIDGKFDVTIEVGVGTGSQEVKITQLISMLQMTAPMIEQDVVSKENMQELLKQIYLLMGYKTPERYVGDQNTHNVSPQEMQQMQQQMQQLQQQLQQAGQVINQLQADQQNKAAELQLKDKKIMLDNNIDQTELSLKEKELMLRYTEDDDISEKEAAELMLKNKEIILKHEIENRKADTNEFNAILGGVKNDSPTR